MKPSLKPALLCVTLTSLLAVSQLAAAAVSAEEAARLKTTLTPLGAEKAGNKEGTIPEWTGGLSRAPAGKAGKLPADPFPGEKPLFQITAKNAAQYADKLSDGTMALLRKYPDTYRVDVYKTHRTVAAPQAVYDNTFRNATRAKLIQNGLSLEGAYAGVPFPIPKTGQEAFWNHTLRVRPANSVFGYKNIVGSADGKRTLVARGENNYQAPYYNLASTPEKWNGDFLNLRLMTKEPPFKSGESLVVRENINVNESRQAWQYLVGQRRVRRAPTVGYDTPDFVASGANYFDEAIGFWGLPDRYDLKLVGKKELYIPYNEAGFFQHGVEEAFVPHHTNPDKVRWELHRVWVIDATLAPGKRHAVPKRRFYLDEDSWAVSLLDGYDAEGKLWRTSQIFPFIAPEVPAQISDASIIYNLQASTFSIVQFFNGEFWQGVNNKPDSYYTGEALGAEGVR
jgi:hypothetical protein